MSAAFLAPSSTNRVVTGPEGTAAGGSDGGDGAVARSGAAGVNAAVLSETGADKCALRLSPALLGGRSCGSIDDLAAASDDSIAAVA